MKRLTFFIILISTVTCTNAQQFYSDSLIRLLSKTKEDTTRVDLLSQLSWNYYTSDPDSAYLFGQEGYQLAQSIGYAKGQMHCKENLAVYWWSVGDYATATKLLLQIFALAHSQNDSSYQSELYSVLASVHRDQGDYNEAFQYILKSGQLAQKKDSQSIGSIYYEMNKPDSALVYLKSAESYDDGYVTFMLGKTYAKLNRDSLAFYYYRRSIRELIKIQNLKDLAGAYNSIAELFNKTGITDSALYYATHALNIAQKKKFNKEILQSYLLLSDLHIKTDPAKAFNYLKLALAAKDNLYNQEKQRQILSYKFNEELRKQETEKAQAQYKNQIKIYILLGILIVFLGIGVILWRHNQHRKKAYAQLEEQKKETDQQKAKAEQALANLKSTQSQLIQSEKMASLGELTAGIAHEIQNPLNFVNNFSEVNKELIDEMQQELIAGNNDGAICISKDIKDNEQKINDHGKRADVIVKSMLQHSRVSSGQKELTNINALTDEYLRLSYHGMRAKDKSLSAGQAGFNVTLETEFDNSIGKINVIPQDIGRVLLNLFNNAFYAVSESSAKAMADRSYQPIITVSTKKIDDKVEIRIADNGKGIPQKVRDKIFQPFFTTKPAGQGTGLGLSLSYDIIKAHGGEIKVESKEARPPARAGTDRDDPVGRGEGATFIIQLPINRDLNDLED